MKVGTVALIIQYRDEFPVLVGTLSDDSEIAILETALDRGENDPLNLVHEMRSQRAQEDEEFGNYVEGLLSKPFVKPDVQEHGLKWLKSKIKIEKYRKSEFEAVEVIARYAYKVFQENPTRTDFYLAGKTSKVRVRVFTLPENHELALSRKFVA